MYKIISTLYRAGRHNQCSTHSLAVVQAISVQQANNINNNWNVDT